MFAGTNSLKQSRRSILMAGLAVAGAAAQQSPKAPIHLPRKLKLGIIGFDGHVDEIYRALPLLPDVELVAVADAGSDPGTIASSKNNRFVAVARRYPDADAMLRHETLDVVAVCNNDGDRAAAIQACAARKVNVIAEKPLAVSRLELDAVYQAVSRNSIRLGMLLPMRFDPQFLAMKQIVASGQIGEVLQIDAQKSYQLGKRPEWQKNQATYGSTILWIGIHMIDLMSWASGRRFAEAASFQARAGFPEMRDMETVTASIFRLDNGGTGTLRMDYLRPAAASGHGDDRLRLAGTKGVVEFQESTGVTLVTSQTALHKVRDLPEQQSVFIDFLQSTYAGAKPVLSWQEIVRANEYTLAAHEAAQKHRIEKIGNY